MSNESEPPATNSEAPGAEKPQEPISEEKVNVSIDTETDDELKSPPSLQRVVTVQTLGANEFATLKYDATANYDRVDVHVRDKPYSEEQIEVGKNLCLALALRDKYVPSKSYHNVDGDDIERWSKCTYKMLDGVFQVHHADGSPAHKYIPYSEFENDLTALWSFCKTPAAKSHCFQRTEVVRKKFELYMLLNRDLERQSIIEDPKDIYNIAKVDNHIHMAAGMTSMHLLSFIKRKLAECPNDVVDQVDGKDVTLSEAMASLGSEANLTLDSLGVQSDSSMFHRFDFFNQKYNPFGMMKLRTIFLKTTNHMRGKYFAEITKEVFRRNEEQVSNVYLEPRLSIYGRKKSEWSDLATWVNDYDLYSDKVRWMIQVPRVYRVFKKMGRFESMAEMLDNVFQPLFEVTLRPAADPGLAQFLQSVVAFDSVDDESHYDELVPRKFRPPQEWNDEEQPPYSYFMYYMWANINALNVLRRHLGLNQFAFRPHCGESGNVHHLASGFLVANSINHGIKLKETPVLMYLFYLCQIGLSVAPLSNNVLFTPLEKNPFRHFFDVGLNVTLSTDDPMQFHTTQEPLMEEYTIARQFWKLSAICLAEIARNSVLQSGFDPKLKQQLLGSNYRAPGVCGTDVSKCNIPKCRASFRHMNLIDEYQFVWNASREKAMSNLISNNLRASHGWRWLIAELHAAHMWKADTDHNLPNSDGTPPLADQLSFKKGELIVVLEMHFERERQSTDFDNWQEYIKPSPHALEKKPTAERPKFWWGRDSRGKEGLFPCDKGILLPSDVERTSSLHFLFRKHGLRAHMM